MSVRTVADLCCARERKAAQDMQQGLFKSMPSDSRNLWVSFTVPVVFSRFFPAFEWDGNGTMAANADQLWSAWLPRGILK